MYAAFLAREVNIVKIGNYLYLFSIHDRMNKELLEK
jgi:hypothetical protein